MEQDWRQQGVLTHRYSLGFHRFRDAKGQIVPEAVVKQMAAAAAATQTKDTTMVSTIAQPRVPKGRAENVPVHTDNDTLKITSEFVPVSSFIHTLCVDDNTRRFISNEANNSNSPGYFNDFICRATLHLTARTIWALKTPLPWNCTRA